MDFTELLEGIILGLLIIEVVELTYHMWRMRSYEQKIELHIEKMESHIAIMDRGLEEIRKGVKEKLPSDDS